MRVALLETHLPGCRARDTPIPPEGAISEAVETAEDVLRIGGRRGPRYGILAAALRDITEIPRTHDRGPRPP